MIPLTNRLSVADGAHIAYFYNSLDAYIDNAISFIRTGLQLGQQIILIESEGIWNVIVQGLGDVSPDQMKKIKYMNNLEFYQFYGDFVFERVVQNLCSSVEPFLSIGASVRLWGHVMYQDGSIEAEAKVKAYEHACDVTVSELGFLTVCTYNAHKVPTSVHFDMLRSHEYLMTDEEIIRSSLYLHSLHAMYDRPAVFPSLTIQERIETEVDLYKQKLDFVHVVSHEVRNPLTIIKAYASLLAKEEEDKGKLEKLNSVLDYCEVIDHELSHIIATEEVLSTSSLWHKRLLSVRPIFDDVIQTMRTKARTQNVELVTEVDVPLEQICLGNQMGLKLIFSNIISNAVKYSHEGSVVTVGCKCTGHQLQFTVEDDGIGMTQDQLGRLFRKYEKQNQDQTGQGIGLFMVHKLVEQLEGTIFMESSPNQGTRVTIDLPILMNNLIPVLSHHE